MIKENKAEHNAVGAQGSHCVHANTAGYISALETWE